MRVRERERSHGVRVEAPVLHDAPDELRPDELVGDVVDAGDVVEALGDDVIVGLGHRAAGVAAPRVRAQQDGLACVSRDITKKCNQNG